MAPLSPATTKARSSLPRWPWVATPTGCGPRDSRRARPCLGSRNSRWRRTSTGCWQDFANRSTHMSTTPQPSWWVQNDSGWCLRANRAGARRGIRSGFALVSRLGDGVFWYLLMATMILADGLDGLAASAHLAAPGVVALSLYKFLKRWTRRPRPFAADCRIHAWVAPLDEFSFPSGHTLHAVAFTIVALAYYPAL